MSTHVESDGSASPFAPATVIGGRFEIQSVLGRGAMGVVFRARQLSIDRPVALKAILQSRLQAANAQERFVREAWIVGQLAHPNIVTMIDSGTHEGFGYLVFEYLSGRPLSTERGTAMEAGRAVKIARQIARGLSAAHQGGIVHRDLKPSNIQILNPQEDEPFVKLLDFGLAKLLHGVSRTPALTATNQVVGTLRYMSPEQIQGGAIDARADLYALGCILFELLSGAPPFRGAGSQLIEQHLVEPPPLLAEIRPELSIDPCLESIVQILMAKRPGSRFQSATEVESALAGWAALRASSGAEARELRCDGAEEGSSTTSAIDQTIVASSLSMISPAFESLEPADPAIPGSELVSDPVRLGSQPGGDEHVGAASEGSIHSISIAMPVRRRTRTPWIAAIGAIGVFLAAVIDWALFPTADSPPIIAAPIVEDGYDKAPTNGDKASPGTTSIDADRKSTEAKSNQPAPEQHSTTPSSKPRARIGIRNIDVISGPMDVDRAWVILNGREDELARCYTRTQTAELSGRTLLLGFVSSRGRHSLQIDPRDKAADAFLDCTRSLVPSIELEKSRNGAFAIVTAEIGPAKKGTP